MMRSLLVALPLALSACLRPPGPDLGTGSEGSSSGATASSGASESGGGAAYRATIRRTGYGVAHVKADDMSGLLFGQAYAFAEDHACTLADQVVKVRSERAKYFGPGDAGEHLDSDFAYLALDVVARAQRMLDAAPDEVKAAIAAYAAGYNQYLRDTPSAALPGWCAGQDWVKEMSVVDLAAYYIDLGILGGSNQLVPYIAAAQPPGAPLWRPGRPLAGLSKPTRSGFGSNGWALGADKSAGGGGMIVSNPHFPWYGELKLWESHLTVPGQLDIYGVGLMGVPGVLIGFSEHLGWAHTFSDGNRFTFYKLTLDPQDPTQYMYDGAPRAMTQKTFQVEVAGGGSAERTMYFSHYGPILNIDPIGWSSELVLSFRDANIEEPRLIEQFLGMDQATSLDDFKAVYRDVQGIPWVNTMAADREGNAWYIDASATPKLTDAAIAAWEAAIEDDFLTGLLAEQGLVVLDGSDPAHEWQPSDAPTRAPGLVPFDELPQIDRRDFVFNANDSYWLANPAAPLEGYSPLHGRERVPQSPRTRINALLLQDAPEYDAAGADGKFTLDELKGAIMGNHSLTADLLVDALVARCEASPHVEVDGVSVDVRAFCEILAAWDRRFDPGSVGAVLFRELLGDFGYESVLDRGALFDDSFDPDDPVHTPRVPAEPPMEGQVDTVLVALAHAVQNLQGAGLPLSVPLSQLQRAPRGPLEVSVPGGTAKEGIANVVNFNTGLNSTLGPRATRGELLSPTGLTERGYIVTYGASFVMAVELSPSGPPRGEGFLTYSQSEDPRSPHFADQTIELFSKKKWRPFLFKEEDVLADPQLREYTVEGG